MFVNVVATFKPVEWRAERRFITEFSTRKFNSEIPVSAHWEVRCVDHNPIQLFHSSV